MLLQLAAAIVCCCCCLSVASARAATTTMQHTVCSVSVRGAGRLPLNQQPATRRKSFRTPRCPGAAKVFLFFEQFGFLCCSSTWKVKNFAYPFDDQDKPSSSCSSAASDAIDNCSSVSVSRSSTHMQSRSSSSRSRQRNSHSKKRKETRIIYANSVNFIKKVMLV